MRLATSTNMLYPKDHTSRYDDILRTLNQAGFTVLDWDAGASINQNMIPGTTPLTGDHWEEWAHHMRDTADSLGVVFNQAHGAMYDYYQTDAHTQWLHSMTERIMKVCVILGIPQIVYHPYVPEELRPLQDIDGCRKANAAYIRKSGEVAAKYNLKIAVENMLTARNKDGSVYWRYCSHADELVDLVKTIDMQNVQICLDVGHAHIMEENLFDTICKYGKDLIALHIHDNNQADDQHLMPFHGTLCWDDVLRGLRAIHYQGDFTYEIHHETNRAPEALYPLLCKSAFEVGQYLLRQYDALNQ